MPHNKQAAKMARKIAHNLKHLLKDEVHADLIEQEVTRSFNTYFEDYFKEQALTKHFFKAASEAHLIVDKEGIIKYVSPYSHESLGYENEALVGQQVFDFLDDTQKIQAKLLLERIVNADTQSLHYAEFNLKDINGQLKAVSCTLSNQLADKLIQGITVVIKDISSVKATEKALFQSEKRFEDVADVADEVLLELNTKGEILYASNSFLCKINKTKTEVSNQKFYHVFDSIDSQKLKETYLHFCENPKTFKQLDISYTANGKQFWEQVSGKPFFDEKGHLLGYRIVSLDITSLKLKSIALRKSEKRYKNLVDSVQDIIFQINEAGEWVYLNKTWDKLTQLPTSEQLGKPFIQSIHLQDRPKAINAFKKLLNDGVKQLELDVRIVSKGNEIKQVSMVIDKGEEYREHGILTGVMRDVTGERQHQVWIERFYQIIEESSDFMAFMSYDFKIQYVNTALKENIGNETLIAVFEQNKSAIKTECAKTSIWRDVVSINDKQGRGLTVAMAVLLHKDNDGVPLFYSTIMHDISEQKRAEAELVAAKMKAEEMAEAKLQFLSAMSHEIRTPLNAVIGMSYLLMSNQPRVDQLEYIETLKFSAQNLLLLVNDILDFSKITAGKVKLEEVPFDLKEITKNIKQSYSYRAIEKGIDFDIEFSGEIPDVILGDPLRLSQVLNNLISNAFKFTERGYVKVKVQQQEAANSNELCLKFAVEDSGKGISKAQQEQIFEKFVQAKDADWVSKMPGTGLGLSITKELLELFGSSINLISAPDKGSNFWFVLTFQLSTNSDKVATNNRSYQFFDGVSDINESNLPPGLRILLAEDNKTNVMVATKFLKKWDAHLTVVENGEEAVAAVRRQRFDIVLMDLQMPVMNGYEATQAIQKWKKEVGQELPVIALTATVLSDLEDNVFKKGFDDYICKPLNPVELREKLSALLVDQNGQNNQNTTAIESKSKKWPTPYNGQQDKWIDFETIEDICEHEPSDIKELLTEIIILLDELAVVFKPSPDDVNREAVRQIRHKIKTDIKIFNMSKLSDLLMESYQAIPKKISNPIAPKAYSLLRAAILEHINELKALINACMTET